MAGTKSVSSVVLETGQNYREAVMRVHIDNGSRWSGVLPASVEPGTPQHNWTKKALGRHLWPSIAEELVAGGYERVFAPKGAFDTYCGYSQEDPSPDVAMGLAAKLEAGAYEQRRDGTARIVRDYMRLKYPEGLAVGLFVWTPRDYGASGRPYATEVCLEGAGRVRTGWGLLQDSKHEVGSVFIALGGRRVHQRGDILPGWSRQEKDCLMISGMGREKHSIGISAFLQESTGHPLFFSQRSNSWREKEVSLG